MRKREKDQAYWDKRLERAQLTMGRGTTSKLSYVGTGTSLEFISGVERMRDNKVRPEGHAAEN